MEYEAYRKLMDECAGIASLYAAAYPQLGNLSRRAASNAIAARDLARAALRLSVPPTVSPSQVWQMSQLAEGWN